MTNPPGAMPPLPGPFGHIHDGNGNQPLSFDRGPIPWERSIGCSTQEVYSFAQLQAYAAPLIARVAELESALQAYADRQYCLGIEQLRRPECLGWEHKLKTGKFGEEEMNAHKKANEHFGAHFGIYAALKAAKD